MCTLFTISANLIKLKLFIKLRTAKLVRIVKFSKRDVLSAKYKLYLVYYSYFYDNNKIDNLLKLCIHLRILACML